jgi:hypothetical protein
MIKARKDNTIILGLSDENIKRLKEGQPIKFNLKEHGFSDIEVFIFNGKDEESMYLNFINNIGTKTKLL